MKNYKYILGVSMLGLLSGMSAAAFDRDGSQETDVEPFSPAGYHGTRHGGMVKGLPGSESAANLALMNVYPTALQFLIPQDDGTNTLTAVLPFLWRESVNDLKSRVMTGYRLPAGIRFMLNDTEVMKDSVVGGALVTLGSAFVGKSGILQIKIEIDKSRSPYASAMPSPEPVSPTSGDEAALSR